MSVLDDLSLWYRAQCDGAWEHRHGISIASCDNPGWWVKIDTRGTALFGRAFPEVGEGLGADGFQTGPRWLSCQVKGDIWHGAGDETRLEEILGLFLAWSLSEAWEPMALRDLAYDTWLDHAFGHEVRIGRNPWFFDDDQEFWRPTSAEYVAHLTRLFENPEPLVDGFADSQIAQGLTYLVDTMAVGDDGHLADRAVPIAERLRLVASIATLFETLFARRCSPHLSHLDEPGAAALNGRCYMWWDTFPSVGLDGDRHLDEMRNAVLTVMERTLSLNSIACQESALHGLGHWRRDSGGRVESIVDDFVARHGGARPELLRYAGAARSGCVL